MTDKIFKQIKAIIEPASRPRKIKDILYELFKQDYPDLRAFELSEQRCSRYLNLLERSRNEDIENGRNPWFDFNSSSSEYIQGPCFVEPRDSDNVKRAKQNRVKTFSMQKVLENITFSQFELICTGTLHLLGARHFRRTKHSRDQGIDFYGELVLGDLDTLESPFVKYHDNFRLWIVGQAKHYPEGKVSTPEIRNLVGSINLARFKEYASTTDLMMTLPMKSCDPVFAIFLTTGTFSRDARKLAENSGVILKDIRDLSDFLVDKEVGCGPDGLPCIEELINWARQFVIE